MPGKIRLSHERIIDAAARVADRGGIASVSMRSVGSELGVEAMSLYHYVASKEAMLDELSEWAFAKIPFPRQVFTGVKPSGRGRIQRGKY